MAWHIHTLAELNRPLPPFPHSVCRPRPRSESVRYVKIVNYNYPDCGRSVWLWSIVTNIGSFWPIGSLRGAFIVGRCGRMWFVVTDCPSFPADRSFLWLIVANLASSSQNLVDCARD
jgi:hypothetical protein